MKRMSWNQRITQEMAPYLALANEGRRWLMSPSKAWRTRGRRKIRAALADIENLLKVHEVMDA